MKTIQNSVTLQKRVENNSTESETIKHIYDDLIDHIVSTIPTKDHDIKNNLFLKSTINPVLHCLIDSVIDKIPERDKQQDRLCNAVKNIQDCLLEVLFQSDTFSSDELPIIANAKIVIKKIVDDHVLNKIPDLAYNHEPTTSRNRPRVKISEKKSVLDDQIAMQ